MVGDILDHINKRYPNCGDLVADDIPLMLNLIETNVIWFSDNKITTGVNYTTEHDEKIKLARDEVERAMIKATSDEQMKTWQPWARLFSIATGFPPIFYRYWPWISGQQRQFATEMGIEEYKQRYEAEFTEWLTKRVEG